MTLRWWAGLLVPLLLATSPGAQAPLREDVQVVLVELEVSVRDAGGRPVAGLPQGSFTVLEAGVPQSIAQLEEVPARRVVLLLDVSRSMEGTLWSARRAARDLLSALGPGGEVAVVGCADGPETAMDFTEHPAEAAAALSALPAAQEEGTALLDCLGAAAGMLTAGPEGGRALVAISDGAETTRAGEELESGAAELSRRLQAVGVRLEVLGYGREGWLGPLSRSTGGSWRSALAGRGVVEQLGLILGHHYRIAYYPGQARRAGAPWKSG